MEIYIEIYIVQDKAFVNLESFIVLHLFSSAECQCTLKFIELETKPNDFLFSVLLEQFTHELVNGASVLNNCFFPLIKNKNFEISGICSVARQLVKCSENEEINKLLGFREACLMACNESSIWTKFCEIDMIDTVKKLLSSCSIASNDEHFIPTDLLKLEYHLEQPVRIHNVYKVAREQSNVTIESSVPLRDLNLNHKYGEGPFMTLADLMLFPCIYIALRVLGDDVFDHYLPLVSLWYKNMLVQTTVNINMELLHELNVKKLNLSSPLNLIVRDIPKQSLYISDPNRYRPKNRIYTKQIDIENALSIIHESGIDVSNDDTPYGFQVEFSWDKIPLEANPEGGSLPKSRSKRKCEQLENMAKAAIKLASDNDVIVDFCSGSGHLGILLAVLLPNCRVILLENKEKSLLRAKATVDQLNLRNVTLLQCNLDYFTGDFDIGVSLHACGVATDLVLNHCLRRKAHFVSCPCCYGGVHNCHHLSYPRSASFKSTALCLRDYLVLGHSADQTHDADNAKTKQGFRCMNVIDTDRKLYVQETHEYDVYLGKLQPHTCTQKNNILVGVRKTPKIV